MPVREAQNRLLRSAIAWSRAARMRESTTMCVNFQATKIIEKDCFSRLTLATVIRELQF